MTRKKRHKTWGILILLVGLAVLLYAKLGHEDRAPLPYGQSPRYSVEKTGAGTTADFVKASRAVHQAVDQYLAQAGLAVQDKTESNKEVPRTSVEGTIRWHARQMLIGGSAQSGETLRRALSNALEPAGAAVLAVQTDRYQGKVATRVDIGLKDQLAGEPVTVITDQLYFIPASQNEAAVLPKGDQTVRARLAFVIDDFGYSREPIAAYAAIDRPLTFAVLPYRPYSNEAAAAALRSGHQVMLHLPMEPLSNPGQQESTSITVDMTDAQIRSTVLKALSAVPGVIGVNNHQGSKATGDRRVMKDVLGVLKEQGLFFVDSRTSGQSVAYETARQMGVRTGINEHFIDNSSDVSAIKREIRNAAAIALRDGTVTIIGHARMNTVAAVREMIPELEAQGIQLVFVAELLR